MTDGCSRAAAQAGSQPNGYDPRSLKEVSPDAGLESPAGETEVGSGLLDESLVASRTPSASESLHWPAQSAASYRRLNRQV